MTTEVSFRNNPPINQFFSPRTQEALKTSAYALANIAIIASLIAVTILFPHIMVPVWIGTGALLAFHGLVFLLFRHYALRT